LQVKGEVQGEREKYIKKEDKRSKRRKMYVEEDRRGDTEGNCEKQTDKEERGGEEKDK
jgi:hypothetical protein